MKNVLFNLFLTLSFLFYSNCNAEEFPDLNGVIDLNHIESVFDTGSRSDLNYFRKCVSREALIQADNHVKESYPFLCERYLKDHAEIQHQ